MRVSLASLFPVPLLTYATVVYITLLAMTSQSNLLLLRSAHHRLYHSDELIFSQGLVPGGESVILQPPNGSNYSWTADVQAGTSLIFFMTDSQGRQGGASDVVTVAASTDGSCLVAGSVSSTVSAPSQPTSNQITSSGNKAHNAGIIAGATVGGVVFLGLLIILGICCKRRGSRSLGVMSSHKRQSSQLQRKDDGHEAKQDDLVQQNYPSQYHVDRVSHFLPTVQPGNQSHLINTSANDPHMRQISYTDSFAGSSSISSAVGGQTALPNPYPYQTIPLGLAPPVHPGAHSHLPNASAGNFTINDPHASFMQIQPSRLNSNLDAFTRYGDAGSSSVSSRPVPVMPGQTASQYYPFQYQTNHVGQPAPPIQPESIAHLDMSAGSIVSDPPSPSATEHRLNSIIERFTKPADAGSSYSGGQTATATSQTAPTQVLVHTDLEDVSSAANSHTMVELPPQYADRQLHPSQPVSALKEKSSQL
jgi:hypothetical protein